MGFEYKLPAGFEESIRLDPENDKRLGYTLWGISAGIAAAVVLLGCAIKNIGLLFDAGGAVMLVLRLILVAALGWLSLAATEYFRCERTAKLTQKPAVVKREKYWLSTETRCWFDLKSYAKLSVLPVFSMCLILVLMMMLLPERFFWQIYVIFTMNLAAAAGDVYVLFAASRQNRPVRIKKEGQTALIATEK